MERNNDFGNTLFKDTSPRYCVGNIYLGRGNSSSSQTTTRLSKLLNQTQKRCIIFHLFFICISNKTRIRPCMSTILVVLTGARAY